MMKLLWDYFSCSFGYLPSGSPKAQLCVTNDNRSLTTRCP